MSARRCNSKYWCFTTFNVENEPKFDPLKHDYIVFGRESCPNSHRLHLQGFVVFKIRQRLSAVKKLDSTGHFQRMPDTPVKAAAYCKKGGDYKEFGSLPTVNSGDSRFSAVLKAAKDGNIDAIKKNHPEIYIRYKARIESLIKYDVTELKEPCGVWICGPPMCGKDYGVYKLGDVYGKSLNKWWDGYRNEKYVLISNIEPGHKSKLGNFLKIWCDCYAFWAEIKGSSIHIRPKMVYCTSNFRLEEVFDGKILENLQTRFNVYDMFTHPTTLTRRIKVAPSYDILQSLLEHGDLETESLDRELPGTIQSPIPSTSVVDSEDNFETDSFKQKKARRSETENDV